MFQLSKRVEYGLIALCHMAKGQFGEIFTAKEIALQHRIPYDLLAKVMQKLTKKGFIHSHQGVKGGYVMSKHPSSLSLASIIDAIEDKHSVTLMQCESEGEECCNIQHTCTIKEPLVKLQGTINKVMSDMTVMELI